MSGFHEVSLPLALAIGAAGGPERMVDVVRLASGVESRNARWAQSRQRWEVGGAAMRADAAHELVAFFEARGGRRFGFRFRDPVDWKSCSPGSVIGSEDQTLGDVVADVCARAGLDCDVSGLAGVVSGYGLAGPVSARAVLEPLVQAHGVDATERDGAIVFRMRGAERVEVDAGRLVEEDGPALSVTRERLEQDEVAVRLRFVDAEGGYMPGHVRSDGSAGALPVEVEAPLAMDRGQAEELAERLAEELTLISQRAGFAMAADGVGIEAGDVVVLGGEDWRVVAVSDGKTIAFEAVRAGASVAPVLTHGEPVAPPEVMHPVEADVVIVDAPALPGEEDDTRPIGFAFAERWGGSVAILGGADADQLTVRGRIERPCAMGRLVSGLYPPCRDGGRRRRCGCRLPAGAWRRRARWRC